MTNDQYDVAILVVSYNSSAYIEDCLSSLIRFMKGVTYKIVVVDNASSDNSVELASQYPDVVVVSLAENTGFGAANNYGSRLVSANYYYLFNVDAYLERDYDFSLVLKAFEHCNKLAIAGTRIVYPDGSSQTSSYTFSSPSKWGMQLFGFNRLAGFIRKSSTLSGLISKTLPAARSYLLNHEEYLADYSVIDVDWISGASMIVSAEYASEFGMFDEGIFLYGEDEDICISAHKNGWKVALINTPPVSHVHGWNSKNKSSRTVSVLKYSSLRYFIKKNFGGPKKILMLAMLPIYVLGVRRGVCEYFRISI